MNNTRLVDSRLYKNSFRKILNKDTDKQVGINFEVDGDLAKHDSVAFFSPFLFFSFLFICRDDERRAAFSFIYQKCCDPSSTPLTYNITNANFSLFLDELPKCISLSRTLYVIRFKTELELFWFRGKVVNFFNIRLIIQFRYFIHFKIVTKNIEKYHR